ncbi:MAG: aromatic amino acid ammonia-lyase [Acidimicrobiales bacterium]|jgi:histidine ammonia-lyase
MTVVLDGASLSLADVVSVAVRGDEVTFASGVRERMQAHREVVLDVLARGEPVYGLTTGVAERKRVTIREGDRTRFNRSLLRTHRMAQGPMAPAPLVRATMLVLANAFAIGVAGVRPELADLLLEALRRHVVPAVRTLGSVGEADLGPLADLADWLVEWAGFELAENEGLALLDNNAFSTAWSVLAVAGAEQLLDVMDLAAALDFEAYVANVSALHPVVAGTRGSPGVSTSLSNLRRALEGSVLWQGAVARNLQDPLTFRCVPQVNGAARDAVSYAREAVERELNAVQSNPVVVLSERAVVSVGSFDVVAMSAALDFARIGLAPAVTSAAERTVKLLQSPFSGLAPGLSDRPEEGDDGLAEMAVAAQSFAAEARLLAQPVSYEMASSTKAEGIEDRTTMAPLSARRLDEVVSLASRVVAIELTVATQAIDLRRLGPLGRGTGAAHAAVRRLVAATSANSPFPDDLEPLVEAVRSGALVEVTKPA